MKILVVGGGSGGHITPAVATVREIFQKKPRAKVEFWTDRKYFENVTKLTTEMGVPWDSGEAEEVASRRRFGLFVKSSQRNSSVRVLRLPAGKFRRYSGWKLRDYFRHFDITLKDLIWGNFCGFCGFLAGLMTALWRLLPKANRPAVVFLKGGYVCLPVGLVARLLKIPYIIHESDSVPGLANRVLMKKATVVAFGTKPSDKALAEHKNYIWTGIPVAKEFKEVSLTRQEGLKKAFSFNPEKPLVVITGGSQGAMALNEATRAILPELLKFTQVGLVAGRTHFEEMIDLKKYEVWEKSKLKSDFRMWEFNTTMDELLGAADVVVSRAGATTIAELSALKKAVILVPYERLPGSHQVRNAERLAKTEAAKMLLNAKVEAHPELLLEEIRHLVRAPRERADMADRLHAEAKSDAAATLAEIILRVGSGNRG